MVEAEAAGIVRVVLENPEAETVVTVEAVLGPEPHESPAVLDDGVDRALGQAGLDPEPTKLDGLSREGPGSEQPGGQAEQENLGGLIGAGLFHER